MTEEFIKSLYDILQTESSTNDLSRIPKDLYRNLAVHIKSLRNHADQKDDTIMKRLAMKECELTMGMVRRIVDIRLRKVLESDRTLDDANLTAEEKYLVESLLDFKKMKNRMLSALAKGDVRHLHTLTERHLKRYKVVRFLQDSPALAGTDGRTYGPFNKEDVATLPLENSRLLEKQGKVEEIYSEHR